MTRVQLEWILLQCIGPALTYASYADQGALKPNELKRYDDVILPAMKSLEKLIKEAKS